MWNQLSQSARAVIFDMDGLLVDSEPIWQQAEQEIFASLGVQIEEKLQVETTGMTLEEVTDFWHRLFPWDQPDKAEVGALVVERVGELFQGNGRLLPGAQAFLEHLRHSGTPMGLATNSPAELTNRVLGELKLGSYLSAVVTVSHVPSGKPAPDIYLECARQLGVSPDRCIVFEDSPTGARAALAAGMTVVAIPSELHLSSDFPGVYSRLASMEQLLEKL